MRSLLAGFISAAFNLRLPRVRLPMTGLIAVRNLLHDRVRLAVTLTGVVFSVVLIAVQGGLFVGFTSATSCVIENTDAEVWVASRGVRNFDVTNPLKEAKYLPGLVRAWGRAGQALHRAVRQLAKAGRRHGVHRDRGL